MLAFADIAAAVEDFNRGDVNLADALCRIRAALAGASVSGDHQQQAA
jgi:hypothetical protein